VAQPQQAERAYRDMVHEEFRRLAPIYDFFAMLVRGMRRRAAAMAGVPAGGRILDVCTGTGEQALAFARLGYQVDALDLSPDMLAVAARKDLEGRVRWPHGDATSLPFADDTFHLTTVSLALHDMPRPVRLAVLAEMRRVTRPDGRILVVDYGFPRSGPLRAFYRWFFGLFELDYFHDFLREDLEDLVSAAGLRVVRRARSHIHAFALLLCDPLKAGDGDA